jgi:predicted XRE-type DNA-binding protein
MQVLALESRIILAIEAIQTTPRLTLRRAAKQFDVPRSTLSDRMAGKAPKADKTSGKPTLTSSEEEAIVQYVLQLDLRGFSPRRADVLDMADLLLGKRAKLRVGKNWTDRFITRRLELRTCFSRAYDYQRGLQEDPDVLNAWFCLVANMRAKYGIQDCDFYNFDETGFMMGMIRAQMVVTRLERIGRPKAIQPSNREWATAICSVAADGHVVPPFLCVVGRFHLAAWYSSGHIPANWVVKTT